MIDNDNIIYYKGKYSVVEYNIYSTTQKLKIILKKNIVLCFHGTLTVGT